MVQVHVLRDKVKAISGHELVIVVGSEATVRVLIPMSCCIISWPYSHTNVHSKPS